MNTANNEELPGCTYEERNLIKETLIAIFGPHCTFSVFGSRVNGTHRANSDLDVLISSDQPIPLRAFAYAKESFEESNLSFRVDLLDKANLTNSFIEQIRADLVAL